MRSDQLTNHVSLPVDRCYRPTIGLLGILKSNKQQVKLMNINVAISLISTGIFVQMFNILLSGQLIVTRYRCSIFKGLWQLELMVYIHPCFYIFRLLPIEFSTHYLVSHLNAILCTFAWSMHAQN